MELCMFSSQGHGEKLGNAKLGKSVHAWIEQRKSNGSSNLILGNALLDMYVKCKKLEFAQGIFDTLVEKEIISWNTMIAGHAKVGELDLAMIAGHDL
nr:pentatricopeptide repeat-containing protein, mitochondrial [Quercus suber]